MKQMRGRYKMKNKMIAIILFSMVLIATLAGCSSEKRIANSDNTYRKITAEEAKTMMDQQKELIILDVRTAEEFSSGHIQGAINISDTDITATVGELIPDKTETILVYCRSGNRSAKASKELIELGYSDVYDFGGIIDWKYDIVTE